jgi:hypothetical protein
VSAEAVGWVYRHSPFRGSLFTVHLAVADSVNDQRDNEFWMTQSLLAAKTRLGRQSVNDALETLVAGGFLQLAESGGGRSRACRYLFLFPDAPVVYETRKLSSQATVSAPQKLSSQATVSPAETLKLSPEATESLPILSSEATGIEPKEDLRTKESRSLARERAKRALVEWQPSPSLVAWSLTRNPQLQITDQVEQFRDHHLARWPQPITDWDAAWRTWVRNSKVFGPQRSLDGSRPPPGRHVPLQARPASDYEGKSI